VEDLEPAAREEKCEGDCGLRREQGEVPSLGISQFSALIHDIFAQGEGLMSKFETFLHGEKEEPEPETNRAQMRANLIRQEINRLQNWQLRMVKLYQLTGPTPAALPPEQQADYDYVEKRIRCLRNDLQKWEQLASLVNRSVY